VSNGVGGDWDLEDGEVVGSSSVSVEDGVGVGSVDSGVCLTNSGVRVLSNSDLSSSTSAVESNIELERASISVIV